MKSAGLRLADLAASKGLPEEFLRDHGLRDDRYYGQPAVAIEYRTKADSHAYDRYRIALTGDRFRQPAGTDVIPYGLGKLMTEGNQASIVLSEGETDALTCWLHQIPALGIPGSSTWKDEWAEYIDAPIVYVIQEPGPGGKKLVHDVARSPLAPNVMVVQLPGAKDLNEFYLVDPVAFVERFRAALDGAMPLPEPIQETEEHPTGIVLLRAADVEPIKPSFAWDLRIPLGSVSLLAGQPGLGKTLLATELVARLSHGQLAGGLMGRPVDVLYLSAEDSPSHTLVPRLTAAGADLERVTFLTIRDAVGERGLALPDDIDKLADAIRCADARMVVIDPVVAHLATGLDSHRDHSIRRALAPLAALADESAVAIVGVVHLNKSASSDLFGRIGGSIGLTAAARSVLVMGADPDAGADSTERVVAHGKSNLSALAPAVRVRIESRIVHGAEEPIETAGIAWLGEAPNMHVSDLLGALGEDRAELSPRREAEMFLRELLADGAVPSAVVKKAAGEAGIALASLRRAKTAIRAKARKVGMPGGGDEHWEWSLPEAAHQTAEGAEGAQFAALSLFGNSEHLREDEADADHRGTPAAHGARCPKCAAGPFVSQDWFDEHWDANHEWPDSVTQLQ